MRFPLFRLTIQVSLLVFLLFPVASSAMIGDAVSESLSVSLRPERPKPYDTVTVSIQSYSVDLTSSEISWFVNGELKKRGTGDKSLTFSLGAPGTKSEVTVVIAALDGGQFRKSLTIRPADVSLIWEAESYTPPFYKGKSRFSYQGVVRVIALPSIVKEGGVSVSPQNLVYTWKKNGRVIPDQSGYGARTVRTEGTIPIREVTIEVEVATTDSMYVAASSIVINPEKPSVILYENHPLLGILFNKAMTETFNLSGSELVIAAVPFYFDTPKRSSNTLNYGWNVNGSDVSGFSSNLILRKQGENSGNTAISLRVSNSERLFQFADQNASVSISEGSGSALFTE